MKVKTKKILTISLPVTFGMVTLATSTAAIVSCSSNNVEQPPVIDNSNTTKEIPISNENIEKVKTNLNNKVSNITIAQFNYYFDGSSTSSANKQTLLDQLGIGEFKDNISNIEATGEYNDATIKISTNDGFKFVENNDNSPSIISNTQSLLQENALLYEHVTFAQYPTINSFVNGINLNNEFNTITSNSALETPVESLKQEITTKISNDQNFDINIWSLTNKYFNVSLPQTVDSLFDVTGMDIDGATIKWSIEGTSSVFAINNQSLYNKSEISNLNSVTLIGNIEKDGAKVANDVKLTFNLKYGVTLNTEKLEQAFYSDGYSTIATSTPNIFNINFHKSTFLNRINSEGIPTRINLTANIGSLCGVLKESIQPFFNNLEINNIEWKAPTPNYWGDLNEMPNFDTWTGNESSYDNVVSFSNAGSCSVDWIATISFNDESINPIQINFYVNISIGI